MKELNFNLTVAEANTILQALGNMPFAQVYPLIQKLQEQAAAQMSGALETPAQQHEAAPTVKSDVASVTNGEPVLAD